jgi:DSF synthase
MNREFYEIFRDYREIAVRYDAESRAVWCYYNPSPRPCFSLIVLDEARQIQRRIVNYFDSRSDDTDSPIRYLVMASQVPGVFNLGGDLGLFVNLIREKNRAKLLDYATRCIKICYLNAVNLNLPITTISLVEGMALGGGFESALSSSVLLATENAEMGFPEIRFNLFPGMGAYSLMARIIGMTAAENMIASGKIYSARELYDKGVVNYLAEPGQGYESVRYFIRQHQRSSNGRRALQLVRQRYNPIDYQELADITQIWVDAALRLKDKDLRMMERLVNAQVAKVMQQEAGAESLLRTIQDRRFVENNVSFPLTDWSGDEIMSDRRINRDRRSLGQGDV